MAFRKIINDSEGGQKYVTEQEEELVFDQVPTKGSFNPVTSNGVAKAIEEASDDITKLIPEGASEENKLVTERNLESALSEIETEVESIDGKIPQSASSINKMVTEQDLQNAQDSWQSGFTPKGESTVSALNSLTTQSNGDQYIVTDSGTLTDGSLAVSAGETVAWDGTNEVWYKVSQYVSKTNNLSFSDFSITDGAGHSVLEVENGHLKTKNFDSSDPKKALKILHIGNSFGYDSMSYVPYILKSVGIDVLVGISYKGANSIDQMNSEYTLADTAHDFSVSGDSWTQIRKQSIQDAVKFTDWDVIIIQQKADLASNASSYSNLSSLIDKVLADSKPGVSLALSIPSSYQSGNNETGILTTSKEIFESYPFQTCFCYGTAIFDSRNGLLLPYNGGWATDGVHLNEGLPCYVAACAMAETILESFYSDGRSVLGNSVRPTQAWIDSINVISQQGTSVGVTDSNCIEAQKIAIKANKFKFQIKE